MKDYFIPTLILFVVIILIIYLIFDYYFNDYRRKKVIKMIDKLLMDDYYTYLKLPNQKTMIYSFKKIHPSSWKY